MWPAPSELLAGILFGTIGFMGWRYGRRHQQPTTWALGIALMVYPYLVSGPLMLWGTGVLLTILLWAWR